MLASLVSVILGALKPTAVFIAWFPARDLEWLMWSLMPYCLADLLRLPLRLFYVRSDLGTAATMLLLIFFYLINYNTRNPDKNKKLNKALEFTT